MESLITTIPGWDGDAAFGFNQGTLVILLIFLLGCVGIRMALANYISKVFKSGSVRNLLDLKNFFLHGRTYVLMMRKHDY